VGKEPLLPQILRWFSAVRRLGHECVIVLATHSSLNREGTEESYKVQERLPGINILVAEATEGSNSAAYLVGMLVAMEYLECARREQEKPDTNQCASIIVNVDGDGVHNPDDLHFLLDRLYFRDFEVVLGSRRLPGSGHSYPLARRMATFIGTLFGNMFLRPYKAKRLSDYTCGFQAMKVRVVKRLFEKHPPNTWVSVSFGPYHLQNPELRIYLQKLGFEIDEVALKNVNCKKGAQLKTEYLIKAFQGFLKLKTIL
jgi:hypothetical protein